ncbi:hypothetical protein MPH_01379 [Macrophomina phaseolina MS6]|uniref:Uncharacterized protein n=1 Tax=Macrophomina phaseolina (strain MS6) TaxID=1126212 RepID=K2S927_MACPH|nr:hypothetical protein MPH_01379 [Macrophomina phaseolina MS6]
MDEPFYHIPCVESMVDLLSLVSKGFREKGWLIGVSFYWEELADWTHVKRKNVMGSMAGGAKTERGGGSHKGPDTRTRPFSTLLAEISNRFQPQQKLVKAGYTNSTKAWPSSLLPTRSPMKDTNESLQGYQPPNIPPYRHTSMRPYSLTPRIVPNNAPRILWPAPAPITPAPEPLCLTPLTRVNLVRRLNQHITHWQPGRIIASLQISTKRSRRRDIRAFILRHNMLLAAAIAGRARHRHARVRLAVRARTVHVILALACAVQLESHLVAAEALAVVAVHAAELAASRGAAGGSPGSAGTAAAATVPVRGAWPVGAQVPEGAGEERAQDGHVDGEEADDGLADAPAVDVEGRGRLAEGEHRADDRGADDKDAG